jgi:hypothetical protein
MSAKKSAPDAQLSFARHMRGADRFHPKQDEERLLRAFYPENPGELALDLSTVTSLFYGLLLQVAAEQVGPHAVDAMSRALFYRLGRAKASATRAQRADRHPFFGDTRDLITILISAIYNASPEYVFHVEHYDAEQCCVLLSGVDRYYRAARDLGLVEFLRWPTLHPFFEGIRDELGIACSVESQLIAVEHEARLRARYVFRRLP